MLCCVVLCCVCFVLFALLIVSLSLFALFQNGQFARFLEQAQQDPRSMGLSIADLLIEPVQRIPRYKLLLEQLLKYTPESHIDHGNIVAALESVSSAAQHNNEQIRRCVCAFSKVLC